MSFQCIHGIKMLAQLFSIDTLTYHSLHGILLRGYREGRFASCRLTCMWSAGTKGYVLRGDILHWLHLYTHINHPHILIPDVFPCSVCIYRGCPQARWALNYPGNDMISQVKVHSREDCCALCRIHQSCVAWTTYLPSSSPTVPVLCWLKSAAVVEYADDQTVSGLITRYGAGDLQA